MIELNNISKSFGTKTVLNGVSLTIADGEFLTLLGPSGCGKTTLLRILAGLESANAGTIVRDGVDISSVPAQKRECAIMFQSYALFPNLTAKENIAFGLKAQKVGRSEIEQRVSEALAMVHLESSGDKYPAELSGGMQQRVALARSLVIRPKLLLLDEPLSALDAKVRQSLRRQIRMIQKELKITTVMVTHDQDEAMSMSDRIAVMNGGVIEQIDKPIALYDHPNTLFTADFVGTTNQFDGSRIGHAGKTAVIRPERVSIHREPRTGAIPVEIILTEFSGPICRLTCRFGDGELILVDIPSDRVITENLYEKTGSFVSFNSHAMTLFERNSHANG